MSDWEIVRHQVAIAGRVTDAQTGKPIGSAQVTISDGPRAFTAPDGYFHCLDLPAGDYRLQAWLPGGGSRYGQAQVTVSVSHDAEGNIALVTADLELPPTAVQGQITNQDGSPVAMAQVRVVGSSERTFTEAGGNYRLTGLEAGRRAVRVSARGYWEASRTVTFDEAGQVVTGVDLTLTPTTEPKPEPAPEPATPPRPVTPPKPALPPGFTPIQIPGCQLWLTAQAITGLRDGDPVVTWPDSSGHGHDAAQPAARKQPTYQAQGIGREPGVRFDGADDLLGLSFSGASTDHTFFFVYDQNPLGEHCHFLFDAQTGRLSLDGAEMNPPYNLRWQDRIWREVARAVTGPQILTWAFRDRTGHLFRNGTSLGTDTYTPRSLGGKMALGSSYSGRHSCLDGVIAEVIYYNRALTLVESQQVEQYLSQRFGIPMDG